MEITKKAKDAPQGRPYPSIHQWVTELLNQDPLTRVFIMEALTTYAHRVHNATICEGAAMTPTLIDTAQWKRVAKKVLHTHAEEYGDDEA